MRQRAHKTQLRVHGQGRAYAAVIGVTVGMLIAGLAVPLAFGRTAGTSDNASGPSVHLNPGFTQATTPAESRTSPATHPRGSSTPNGGATPPRAGGPSSSAPATGSTSSASSATPARSGLPTSPGTSGSDTPKHIRLTATAQGVTASSVKVGVVLLDIQLLAPLGFSQPHFSPREQRQQYQTFFDQVNRRGGVFGRKIAPVYATYNPLDTNGSTSGGAVCIELAENDKIFAAMGTLDSNIGECLTEQYGIPAIANDGHLAEAYTKSHNLLVTPYASLQRGASDWGDLAVRSGLLRGRTIGTVNTADPAEAEPQQALVKALAADHKHVTYQARFSADTSTAQSQMPVEIQGMRKAGVNTVFLVTSFATALSFVQAATRGGFRPLYVVSDLGSLTAAGLVASMPQSFDGAYAFTQGNSSSPENPQDRRCRLTFNHTTGLNYAPGNESGGVTLFCWMVTVFKDAGDAAGADLTPAHLAAAFQHLGDPNQPHVLPGSFRPGKTDYSDSFRPEKYSYSCKCYKSVGGAQRGRY